MAWGLIRVQDQLGLVFRYVDPVHGPSAKGALVRSTEPSVEDAALAARRPNVTVRITPGFAPIPLTGEQVKALALPEAPPWLEVLLVAAPRPKPPTPPLPEPPPSDAGPRWLLWWCGAAMLLGAAVLVLLWWD